MISRTVKITNPTGLHLRPAGKFCKCAAEFEECSIRFQVAQTTGNAKSVLSVLAACIKQGDEVTLTCDGVDEERAMDAMIELVESLEE